MEASSLTFAGASPATTTRGQTRPVAGDGTGKKPCRIPVRKAAIADVHAPSASLPLRFIISGLLSLLTGVVWLVARPDILATYHYNQYVIAVTHLFVLGWICSVVMGAMYQLVPVALETKLHSERLARWHFVLHTIGFIGMVAMFWVWDMKQVGHFGSAFGFGVGLFVYNLGRTLVRIPRWNVVAAGIASAAAWLFLTMMAGLFLASAKCWPRISPFDPIAAMHAHAHLGVIGFFVTMLVAVSYKLVPMFTLGELQSPQRAGWSIALLNAGLFGLFVTILLGSAWKLAFATIIVTALVLYGWEILAILHHRKRRSLDWGLIHFLTALSLFVPLSALAIVLCWPGLPMTSLTTQLENVYGFVAIIGVVTFAIVGMLYKVVPFLVWYASYSKQIGRGPVPSLGDLYSVRLQAVGYALFVAGLVTTSVAIALGHERCVQWTSALLAGSFLVFAVNMGMILSHLIRPRIQRVTTNPAPSPALS